MRLIAVPCLLLLSSFGMAQSSAPEVTKELMCDGPKACSGGFMNGHVYEIMAADNNVGMLVSVEVAGKYVRADIFVANDSAGNVDVLPSNFVITEVTPKQKPLKYVDGDKMIKSAGRRLAWGNAMTAMGANMQRQQSSSTTYSTGTINASSSDGITAMGTYHGSSTANTSAPNYAAQAQAAETIRDRNEAFANTAEFASRTLLRANTLLPSGKLRGYLFFERDKKEKLVILSAIIGDTMYQFPFLLTAQ